MSVWNQKLRQSMLAVGVCAAVGFAGGASAQQSPHGGAQGQMPQMTEEQQALMQEMRAVQQELQQTQRQLQQMEQQAYEANPELGEQREALQAKIAEKMSGDGYDAEKEFDDMKATVERFQGGEQEPTQAEVQAFREQQREFQQRQKQAFEDPEVQEMANGLRSQVEATMRENNPKAAQLFEQMQEKVAEMKQLQQQAMQMQQGG